jgi:hypothetical protein
MTDLRAVVMDWWAYHKGGTPKRIAPRGYGGGVPSTNRPVRHVWAWLRVEATLGKSRLGKRNKRAIAKRRKALKAFAEGMGEPIWLDKFWEALRCELEQTPWRVE